MNLNYATTKRSKLCLAVLITAVFLSIFAMSAGASYAAGRDVEWGRYQGNEDNNGVTSIAMPANYSETALKWGKQIVQGYTSSFTPPIIVDGYLITASGEKVYKINKDTGAVVKESDAMGSSVSYAMHPMTYDEDNDQYYIPLLHGRVGCVDAGTLAVKWVSQPYPSYQSLSPIAYKNDAVYNGTWSGEQSDGVFYALDAKTGKTKWELRPSELKTISRAEDPGAFPTSANSDANYYTETALIKVKAKSGYTFKRKDNGTVYLFQGDTQLGSKIAASVNGRNSNITYDDETGIATLRVIYRFSDGSYTQFGAEGEGGFALTGLSTPVVGQTLDTTLNASSMVEVQSIKWKTGDEPHGFYWAGAYTDGNHVYFGSDDGQNNTFGAAGDSSYTNTAVFYSVDCSTGEVVDRIENVRGDIRSTVVQANGYLYFTSKGGQLYKAKLNGDGTFDHAHVSKFSLSSMMTASPVVHNGRIYVGIAGSGGQFDADGGHKFGVFSDAGDLHGEYTPDFYFGVNPTNVGSLLYTTDIAGYPQAPALLSNNTEQGNGAVRLYFTYNAPPGGIYYLEDSPSTEKSTAKLLFRPESEMQQYSLTPVNVDRQGTMYLKNDSGYMMAVALNKAWADNVSIQYDNKELTWEGGFESGTLNYKLRAPNGAESVDMTLTLPSDVTAEIGVKNASGSISNKVPYNGGKQTVTIPSDYENEYIAVVVSRTLGGSTYSRTYAFKIVPDSNNANVSGIILNNSNSTASIKRTTDADYETKVTGYNTTGHGYDPAFNINTTKYVSRTIDNDREFVNVWFQKDDPKATVKVYPVDKVGNAANNMNADDWTLKLVGTGPYRAPVYWVKGSISSEIRIEVTSPSGKEVKSYNVELVRDKKHINIGKEPLVLDKNTANLYTAGGNTSTSVRATFGANDVTEKCVWESTRPDIVTVDSKGNVSTTGKVGEAVVWARYYGQTTKESPLIVKVTAPIASAPIASPAGGTYYEPRFVYLSTSSTGAEIRYNIGADTTDVEMPTGTSGSLYNENNPVPLTGEQGRIKTYRIRALACNGGYTYDSTSRSTFDYVIDRRERISNVEITDLAQLSRKRTFDTDAACSKEGVSVSDIKWYEKGNDGELTEVTGKPEEDKTYIVKIKLSIDNTDTKLFTETTTAAINGAGKPVTFVNDGEITVSAEYVLPDPAMAPTSNLENGTYEEAKSVRLYTESNGAEIRYNVSSSGEAEWPDENTGAVYDKPVELGENGKIVTYNIKAISCNGGYDSDDTSRAEFEYTVDLRERLADVEITELSMPAPPAAFDKDVDVVTDGVSVTSVKWYEVGSAGELVEVTGNADFEKRYVAKLTVESDDTDSWIFTNSTIGKVNGIARSIEYKDEGKAIISVSHDTGERPVAASPVSTVPSGTYETEKQIELSTDSEGADIRYTVGESDVDSPTEETGTVYDGPFALGEQGTKKTYKVKAIACGTSYIVSPEAVFEYTIDLRTRITDVTLTGLDEPKDGEPFDSEVTCETDKVEVGSVDWYEIDANGNTLSKVTGNAEGGKRYRAVVTLKTDTGNARFIQGGTDVTLNGNERQAVFASEGVISVSAAFSPRRPVQQIRIDGITAPEKFKAPVDSAAVTSDGTWVSGVYWEDSEGSRLGPDDTFSPESEYTVNVVLSVSEGYVMRDAIVPTIRKYGADVEADLKDNEDGTYTVSYSYTTPALMVWQEDNKNVKVEPASIANLPHGTTEAKIRSELAKVKVSVKMEDGSYRDASVYWNAEPKSQDKMDGIEYDPNSYSRQAFSVSGTVTGIRDPKTGKEIELTDDMLGGVVLRPEVAVTVNAGVVADPVFTPQSAVYKTDQQVTIATSSPGAAIYYTRSDESGTKVYVSPISVSAEFGEDKVVTFKAYAMANGVKSKTVTYTIEINKKTDNDNDPVPVPTPTPSNGGNSGKNDDSGTSGSTTPGKNSDTASPADASKNSVNKITPTDSAADAAKENKSIAIINAARIATVGSISRKQMTVKFPSVKGVANYRIAYRKAGAKTWSYAWSKGKTNYVIKKLKRGSLLEFRLAAYKVVNGEWQRSAWSKVSYRYMEASNPTVKRGRKKAAVKLKKVKKANGYHVQYSLKKNMSKVKVKKLAGAKRVKVTIKGLKSKKNYFFRARPYKKYKGKIYLGIYSKVKKIKVK